MIAELQFASGGGLTLNHPVWSRLKPELMLDMLDFDPRVLGIEIWNQTCEQLNGRGWALAEWDAILQTGRRCFGFCVSDHAQSTNPDFLGYNVLLVPTATPSADLPEACLQAYRQGNFYGTLQGKVGFERIDLQGDTLHVETTAPCTLRIISARGTVHEQTGTGCSWPLPSGSAARQNHLYIRIEADQLDGTDRLFSQPLPLVVQ